MTMPPPYPSGPPPWGPPPAPQSRRTAVLVAAIAIPVVLAIVLVASLAFAGVPVVRNHQEAATPETVDWEPYVDAGKAAAQNLTTIDYRTVDQDIQRILDMSTGTFHDDFESRSDEFSDTVRESQSVSEGAIAGVGLESLRTDQAGVLVAIAVKTTNGGAAQQPKSWRIRVTVDKVGDGYKASNVEFVP